MSKLLQELTEIKIAEMKEISDDTGKSQMDKVFQLVSVQCARLDLLEQRMDQAYSMIAHNMFAIVRLEIASSCDAITNTMLDVKREKTGSGNAAMAIQITATLAMIAGNVLTGGGMGVVGAACVAAGNAAVAASKNDVGGMMGGVLEGVSSTVIDGIDASGLFGKTSAQDVADKATIAYDSMASLAGVVPSKKLAGLIPSKKKEDEPVAIYKVKFASTCFVSHGAGGTSAITYDIQTAIVNAYYTTITQLGGEIKKMQETLVADGLLKEIAEAPFPQTDGGDMKSDLHPLTKAVIVAALKELALFKGQYSSVTAPRTELSGTTAKAKAFVLKGYQYMLKAANAGTPFPTSEKLIAELK